MKKLTREQEAYLLDMLSPWKKHCTSISYDSITYILNQCTEDDKPEPEEPKLLQDLRAMANDLRKLQDNFDDFTHGAYK